MKKILVTICSLVVAFSFSTVVFAAKDMNTFNAKIVKQIILSEDEPAPTPAPAPEPEPTPAPTPEPEPK